MKIQKLSIIQLMQCYHNLGNNMIIRSPKILKAAKGQQCTLNIPGICNWNPETTVACHVGVVNKGTGQKCDDVFIVFGCSACHAEIDGKTMYYARDDLKEYILLALEKTWLILFELDLLKVGE